MAKQLHISDLLDIYGSLLTEKQQRLLEYYYNDDLSLAEIAENEGITRQAVRDTLKRAAAQLEQTEKLLGIYKQNAAISEKVDEIIRLCDEMQGENSNRIKSVALSLKEGEIIGI